MLRNAGGGGVVVTSGAEPQAVLDELTHEIDRLNKENAALRQRIQLLTHRLFGRRSEKGIPVIEQLYGIERAASDKHLDAADRHPVFARADL